MGSWSHGPRGRSTSAYVCTCLEPGMMLLLFSARRGRGRGGGEGEIYRGECWDVTCAPSSLPRCRCQQGFHKLLRCPLHHHRVHLCWPGGRKLWNGRRGNGHSCRSSTGCHGSAASSRRLSNRCSRGINCTAFRNKHNRPVLLYSHGVTLSLGDSLGRTPAPARGHGLGGGEL